jgi:hypothetical protein
MSAQRQQGRAFTVLTWICIIEIVFFVASLILFWPRNGRDQPTIPAPLQLLSSCVQSNVNDGRATNVSKQPGTAEYTGVVMAASPLILLRRASISI